MSVWKIQWICSIYAIGPPLDLVKFLFQPFLEWLLFFKYWRKRIKSNNTKPIRSVSKGGCTGCPSFLGEIIMKIPWNFLQKWSLYYLTPTDFSTSRQACPWFSGLEYITFVIEIKWKVPNWIFFCNFIKIQLIFSCIEIIYCGPESKKSHEWICYIKFLATYSKHEIIQNKPAHSLDLSTFLKEIKPWENCLTLW